MTMTDETTRRVRVTHEPVPGVKPWRAVILAIEDGGMTTTPVGRFDTQPEAVTTACSALRFVNAGITWQPVGVEQTEATP